MYRVLELNPQLKPFENDIKLRMDSYKAVKERLLKDGKTLNDFANAHHFFGFHRTKGGWAYREWAPNATQLWLTGEFNEWNRTSHPLKKLENGVWELKLRGNKALWEGCKVKTVVEANGTISDHIPLYARRVVQEKETVARVCEFVDPGKKFNWTDQDFVGSNDLYIYEANIGMAQEEGKVSTYK